MRIYTMIWAKKLTLLFITPVVFFLASCGGTLTPSPTATSLPLAKEISFYNWDGDEVQSVMDAFTEEYGVKVNYVPFDSQEEAIENILAGQVYDIVVLEHSFFPELLANNLLAEIDYANVPNFKNICLIRNNFLRKRYIRFYFSLLNF